MKIWVTGATGLLGRQIMERFESEGLNLLGTGFSRARFGIIKKLDLTDKTAVEEFIKQEKPEVLIHCAAERRPDISARNPEGTLALNVEATRFLAEMSRQYGFWLIYISTDYVFDGKNPPYKETDETNPLNSYGLSKREGEIEIQKILDDFLILRVPILYGPTYNLSESAITDLGQTLLRDRMMKIDHWAVRYPTFTPDVALLLYKLVMKKQDDSGLKGIFHFSGNESYTKYDIICFIRERMKLFDRDISPVTEEGTGTPRPQNSHLDCSKLEDLGLYETTPFPNGLKDVFHRLGLCTNQY